MDGDWCDTQSNRYQYGYSHLIGCNWHDTPDGLGWPLLLWVLTWKGASFRGTINCPTKTSCSQKWVDLWFLLKGGGISTVIDVDSVCGWVGWMDCDKKGDGDEGAEWCQGHRHTDSKNIWERERERERWFIDFMLYQSSTNTKQKQKWVEIKMKIRPTLKILQY